MKKFLAYAALALAALVAIATVALFIAGIWSDERFAATGMVLAFVEVLLVPLALFAIDEANL